VGASTAFQAVALRGTDSAKSNAVWRDLAPGLPARGAAIDGLVVSEVHADPAAVSDTSGEWFEVHNGGPLHVDLEGVLVSDDGGTSFTIDRPLVLAPGGYAVLARDGDASTNGGVAVDFAWTAGFSLANGADEIVLSAGSLLDRVAWTGTDTGTTWSLAPQRLSPADNDDPASWCTGATAFGDGDLGTPGEANPACGVCGDGQLDPGESCDDGSASCSDTCQLLSTCGDGLVDPGEGCDLGTANGTSGATCATDCTPATFAFDVDAPIALGTHLPLLEAEAVTLADLDGDGLSDVVVESPLSNDVVVVPGGPEGPYTPSLPSTVDPVTDVVLTDLDGDGFLDAAGLTLDARFLAVSFGGPDGLSTAVRIQTNQSTAGTGNRLVAADLDGDGRDELVSTVLGADRIVRFANDGSGGLTPRSFPTADALGGDRPSQLQLSDLTGDGPLDVVTLGGHTDVSVLTGLPDGTFLSPVVYADVVPTGVILRDLALSDLDDDGRDDVVLLDADSQLWWMRNAGPTGFSAAASLSSADLGSSADALAVGDVDGDGIDDVVHLRNGTDEVVVRRGLVGAATLGPSAVQSLGIDVVAITSTLSDVDGDGDLDLLVADQRDEALVLLNDGQGGFTLASAIAQEFPHDDGAIARFGGLAAGDVDADGTVDLVTSSLETEGFAVRHGDGDGRFGTPAYRYDTHRRTVVADLDGDGLGDLVRGGSLDREVHLQRAGGFEPPVIYDVDAYQLTAGDVDGDGDVDLVATDVAADVFVVLRNQGDGTLVRSTESPTAVAHSTMRLVDVSGDGHLDLVTLYAVATELRVHLGDGTGAFSQPVIRSTRPGNRGGSAQDVAAGDVDGDGLVDLVVSTAYGDPIRFLGTGGGGFDLGEALPGPITPVVIGRRTSAIELVDLDGDGRLDVVTSNELFGGVAIWRGFDDGVFSAAWTLDLGVPVAGLDVAELDGDGRLDLVVGHATSAELRVLRGR
jgi:hypothetical protein